jgi:hypothetical protein
MSRSELTTLFNAQFAENVTVKGLVSTIENHKIISGRTGQFVKGQEAWNLGVKGYMGPNKTSFKKGSVPSNRKPIGSERICSKDGFILVKIKERNPYTGYPTRYKHKHVHVWEKKHGTVPKGHVVVFKDGNKLNCKPGNLMLLTRAELLVLNQHGYKEAPAELKPTILALVKLETKAGFRSRLVRGRNG